MKASGLTHVGKLRKRNEDAFVILENPMVAIVSDGMGGAPHGDIASQLTLHYFSHEVKDKQPWTVASLHDAVKATNNAVVAEAAKNTHTQGMGATLVAYLNSGSQSFLVNVGDSRAYGLNHEGLKRLSEDHNVMNAYLKRNQDLDDKLDVRYKHMLTSVIGMPSGCMVDVSELKDEYDLILLCSDGLSNLISESNMIDVLTSTQTLEHKAKTLIELANQAGGSDNITLIIIDMRGDAYE